MSNKSQLPESFEQIRVANYLRGNGFLFHHSPNEGFRHVSFAEKIKAYGCSAGFPDVIIFNRPTNPKFASKVGLAIELKRSDGGKLTKNQRRWLNDLSAQDWVAAVCHGHREAIKLINEVYTKKVDKKN